MVLVVVREVVARKPLKKDLKNKLTQQKILKNLPGCVVDCAKPFFIGKGFSLTSQPDNP